MARLIGRVRPPRVTRPGQVPTSRYPGGRLGPPNRVNAGPTGRIHVPGGPGGMRGDPHGPPVVRPPGGDQHGRPPGPLNKPIATVKPPPYNGPQPDSNYSHGNQGGPETKGGGGYHQPGKPPPKPGGKQYQGKDQFARLKALRKRAGITKYELSQNKKLNKLAGALGNQPEGGKRDYSNIKDLVKKLRNSDLNPEGRTFRPGLQKDRQAGAKKESAFQNEGGSSSAYDAYVTRQKKLGLKPLSKLDWVKKHRDRQRPRDPGHGQPSSGSSQSPPYK